MSDKSCDNCRCAIVFPNCRCRRVNPDIFSDWADMWKPDYPYLESQLTTITAERDRVREALKFVSENSESKLIRLKANNALSGSGPKEGNNG
jgi:Zn/Cd-binding protein ZinT